LTRAERRICSSTVRPPTSTRRMLAGCILER
jgi:hypothetical protein